eukprot:7381234-Prymnesium_polylepis.1
MTAAKSAKDEAQRIAAEVVKIDAATAAAAAKQALLIDTFSTLRPTWELGGSCEEQLAKEMGGVQNSASNLGVRWKCVCVTRCILPYGGAQ